MTRRVLATALTTLVFSAEVSGQAVPLEAGTAVTIPERAIRRDIPITNSIRRAFAAGTRDSTGRPGRKYWQLWMDYRIDVRLDPRTSTLTGRQVATLHNRSDSTLRTVVLRLDQNILSATAARLSAPTEATNGI